MSLIETKSFGMVLVVTNVGSVSSVVIDRKNGLFVEVQDVDSIVSAIKVLSSDMALMESLSAYAQRTIFLFIKKVLISKS